MHAEILRIVYDPISWIHPQRFSAPDKLSSVRCRSILNDIILHEFKLSTGTIVFTNSKERYLVCHWSVLAKAAFAAVCHRYRSSLAYHGLILRLDPAVLQFAQAELTDSVDDSRGSLTLDHLNTLACRELMDFSSSVSVIIRERIPLLFPESPDMDKVVPFHAYSDDSELVLRMAIQYAKKNF